MINMSNPTNTPAEALRQLNDKIQLEFILIKQLKEEMAKVIVGQTYMIDRLLIALLADGHVLLEGVPGLAKTLAIKTLSEAIDVQFSRIQFTPDLLPADVTGTMIYNQKSEQFTVKKGPVFANFILADEINRAPAKVQSALLDMSTTAQITDSLKLGGSLLGEIGRVGKLHKSRVEQASFAVLKAPDIPSVLVEAAFISNPKEEAKLNSEEYQNQLADALMRGILVYFSKNPPLSRSRKTG